MKLRLIAEDIKGSKEPIRQAAEVLGELIEYTSETDQSEEAKALDSFLADPTARTWEQTKWVLDSLQQKAGADPDPELQDQMVRWAELGQLSSPVVAASVFDIDPKFAKGTPAKNTSLSRTLRNKTKAALGPQGYVSTLTNTGEISDQKLKRMLKDIAKNSKGLRKATKKLPGGKKQMEKF
jgi:hypothetical protein